MNIISYKWILSCLQRGFLVDLEPLFMIAVNNELRAYFKQNIDEYGDHYTQAVEPDRLRDILDAIPEKALEGKELEIDDDMIEQFRRVLDTL